MAKKGFSVLKQKKWTRHIFYIILHIQSSLVRNFSSNWQVSIFGPNLAKTVFLVKNWKSEHHHWILHIQISPGTKFLLKLTILLFWTKFTWKGYLRSKTEKSQFCVRPWYLLAILNFSELGPATERYYNASSPSSSRDI